MIAGKNKRDEIDPMDPAAYSDIPRSVKSRLCMFSIMYFTFSACLTVLRPRNRTQKLPCERLGEQAEGS